jgi:hypothetical protein
MGQIPYFSKFLRAGIGAPQQARATDQRRPGPGNVTGRREPAGHAHVQQGVDAEEAQAVQLGAPAVPATASSPSKPKVDSAKKKLDPFLHVDVPDVTEQSQPYHSADPDRHRLTLLNA